ncbi:MAG: DUF1501 domain-containing protein, partial [Verrucomicrobia bacterium]|nr:DUF1501 domain-containing protein [Verrucomicrobiota bacterium]
MDPDFCRPNDPGFPPGCPPAAVPLWEPADAPASVAGFLRSRRDFLSRSASGLGLGALAALLSRDGLQASAPGGARGLPGMPQSAPKAKRVIYLFQNGAPTHVDLFDYKPRLRELHGQPIPAEYVAGKRFSTMTGMGEGKLVLAPVEPFHQHGESGAWVSEFLPHTASIADDLCFVKGLHTDAVNHAPGISLVLSGSQIPGRPTLGAWLSYGLGSDSENLPAFVVMTSVSKGTSCGQIFYDFYWGSGFLPSRYQGVKFRGSDEPVLYLRDPAGLDRTTRRAMLDDLAALNELGVADLPLIGVAKGEERKPGCEVLVYADDRNGLELGGQHPALQLIQEVRDEAHRFAVFGHRARREKARRTSVLEDIPGIGAAR